MEPSPTGGAPEPAAFEPPARRLVLGVWRALRGPPAVDSYLLTRWAILRLLGVAAHQLVPLVGEQGLLPAQAHLDAIAAHEGSRGFAFWALPSVFWWDASDRMLQVVA